MHMYIGGFNFFQHIDPIALAEIWSSVRQEFGRVDDAVGNSHRAQILQFELFESILLLKLDKQFPVERFEAAVSQPTVPSHPLTVARCLLG